MPIIVGLVVLILFAFARFLGATDKGEEKILTSSTLVDTIDISELSTSQFTYNGIAEIYKKEKVICHVRYNAKVKAGIDMQDVTFEIDSDNMTVKPVLPEIIITSNPVVDEQALSFIPSDATLDLNEVLKACKEDAEKEATESQELINSAEENLKSIIEALTYPILDEYGYTICWE